MKKLNFVYLVLFALMVTMADAKTKSANVTESDVAWTTIEKALTQAKSDNKKFILVELYTDWCGWCKKMDENTFTEPGVVSLVNANFTAVKFNAEIQTPVSFNGKTYTFTKDGQRGANQLALELGKIGGKLGYPTVVVLDANGTKLQAFPGFKDVETMSAILKYYQSGSYKTMDFQQYQSGQ